MPSDIAANGPAVHFINVEYFMRILYECLAQGCGGGTVAPANFDALLLLLSRIWILISILAYLFCAFAIFVLIYSTIRLYQTKKAEEEKYTTITEAEADKEVDHSRWAHITSLIEGTSESDWRQAIIEADIMLEEVLDQQGYTGATVGDKLKQVPPAKMATLQDAWEAHKVRNDIAHQGSAFQLSAQMAYRTIQRYESVFREAGEI